MPNRPTATTDAHAIRDAWDRAADAYTAGQAAGRDRYRYAFFGPAQVAMCGGVRGLTVLDVGCGGGYFTREMARAGARVTGVDISPRMIAHARRIESESPLGATYDVCEGERLGERFAAASFDLVTSCLALQDMSEPAAALRAMHAVLRPGGRAVLSITHPATDTPYRAWQRDADGRKVALAVDRYFERGPMSYTWTGWGTDFVTPALHAPLEDWFAWLLAAGFTLRAYREPRPTAEALRAHPDLEDAARVPYYAMFDVTRGR